MIDLIDIEDLEAAELLEMQRVIYRNRLRINPFIELSDEDFRQKYRFSKRYTMKIVDLLRENLIRDARGCPVSPEIQVVCALRSWARHEVSRFKAYIPFMKTSVEMYTKSCLSSKLMFCYCFYRYKMTHPIYMESHNLS